MRPSTIVVHVPAGERLALETALRLGALFQARVHVVSTAGGEASQMLQREVAGQDGLAAEVHPRSGDPSRAVLAVAEEQRADLIVVGSGATVAQDPMPRRSVANRISHRATASVLIVRRHGAERAP